MATQRPTPILCMKCNTVFPLELCLLQDSCPNCGFSLQENANRTGRQLITIKNCIVYYKYVGKLILDFAEIVDNYPFTSSFDDVFDIPKKIQKCKYLKEYKYSSIDITVLKECITIVKSFHQAGINIARSLDATHGQLIYDFIPEDFEFLEEKLQNAVPYSGLFSSGFKIQFVKNNFPQSVVFDTETYHKLSVLLHNLFSTGYLQAREIISVNPNLVREITAKLWDVTGDSINSKCQASTTYQDPGEMVNKQEKYLAERETLDKKLHDLSSKRDSLEKELDSFSENEDSQNELENSEIMARANVIVSELERISSEEATIWAKLKEIQAEIDILDTQIDATNKSNSDNLISQMDTHIAKMKSLQS